MEEPRVLVRAGGAIRYEHPDGIARDAPPFRRRGGLF
jgi:hypothetical protein